MFFTPITPQASLPPAFPVIFESSFPPIIINQFHIQIKSHKKIKKLNSPKPKSSFSVWTTIHLPRIECGPLSLIMWSVKSNFATCSSLAFTFPKSPTCRFSASGAPWVFFVGLKWSPALVQPFVVSPNSWTWKLKLELN